MILIVKKVYLKMSEKITSYSSVLGVVVSNKRQEKGIDQAVLAECMGLSQASYSRLESGKATFSVDQMFECAKALGISVEVLLSLVVNTVDNLKSSGDVDVQAQFRKNTRKGKSTDFDSAVGGFVAGAALIGLLVALSGKSK